MLGWFRSKNKKKQDEVPAAAATEVEAAVEELPDEVGEPAEEVSDVAVSEVTAAVLEEENQESLVSEELEIPDESPAPQIDATPRKESSLFGRLQKKLSKTRKSFVYRLDTLFLGKKEIDQELFDDLEEILITADMGVMTTQELLDEIRREVKRKNLNDPQLLKGLLQEKIRGYLVESDKPAELVIPGDGPFVIMVVGVNGVGKTTSIGKIAAKFVGSGKSVLLVAADTFRAAAVDQLKIWAKRCGVDIVAQKQGADPSSVVFDAMEFANSRAIDVVIVDTAGRLHTQVNLMEELKKIKRVMGKKMAGAPHEVMLVLDATTGQNGISQARLFNDAVGVTGLTLTKLDGTAKGGIIVNISRELEIPVRFIGIGEQVDDLRDFDPVEFVDALFLNGENAEAAEG